MTLETIGKTEETNGFRIAHYIDINVPIDTCNFRCHYCYVTQQRIFSSELPKFKHTPEQMAQAFSKKRLGGICVINLCANGETLLAPEMPQIVKALLDEGHIIMVVTNGSVGKAFDEFVKFPQEFRNRLFIKFSFQYLELLRLKLLDKFFDNLQKMKNAGVSFTLEITPDDELIPHIEDIKKVSIERAGALPHISVARDNRDPNLPILTKLSREEYKKMWSQFNSPLFEFKESVFNVKVSDFCYGGQATYFGGLDNGILKQCYYEKTLMNLYDNVNKPIKENPVGCNCHAPHCWNAHSWMGFGAVPSKNETTPLYAEMRNRVCPDGSEWLAGDVKKAFSTRAEVGIHIPGNKTIEGTMERIMAFNKKVMLISNIIDEKLLPVINKNGKVKECVYLDLPYYTNIGDTLIWRGTEHFLRRTGLKCLYKASLSTYSDENMKKIARRRNAPPCKKMLIFLQGGGNFGDLWEVHQNFREKIIKSYTESQIVILPQTVFYNDESKMKTDAELFAKHQDLTICARDKKSYQILKDNFQNEIILVPDMAFCIPQKELRKYTVPKITGLTLLLKRTDKELDSSINYSQYISQKKVDTHDWITIETDYKANRKLGRLINSKKVSKFKADLYAQKVFQKTIIREGVKQISKYENIYSTRLHVAILSILLEKPFFLFDNSYGKNSSFFETWLSDLDAASLIDTTKNGDD